MTPKSKFKKNHTPTIMKREKKKYEENWLLFLIGP